MFLNVIYTTTELRVCTNTVRTILFLIFAEIIDLILETLNALVLLSQLLGQGGGRVLARRLRSPPYAVRVSHLRGLDVDL